MEIVHQNAQKCVSMQRKVRSNNDSDILITGVSELIFPFQILQRPKKLEITFLITIVTEFQHYIAKVCSHIASHTSIKLNHNEKGLTDYFYRHITAVHLYELFKKLTLLLFCLFGNILKRQCFNDKIITELSDCFHFKGVYLEWP